MKSLNNQSGVLLPLGIVVTSVILAASLILATLIIRQNRVSGISDKGQVAFFGSETAAEEAIYRVFKLGQEAVDISGNGTLPNGVEWTRQASENSNQFVYDFIPKDTLVELDLYNRANDNDASGVNKLNFNWSSGLQLDIDFAEWDGNNLVATTGTTLLCAEGVNCSDSIILDPGKAYELIITAKNRAVTDLIIVGNAPSPPETPVVVNVVGEYQGAEQGVQIVLPKPAPWDGSLPFEGAVCGDDTLEGTEECDDGNILDGDGCSSLCAIEVDNCGNLTIDAGEECDDGNKINGDGCSSLCIDEEICGNSIVELLEACDDGNTTDAGICNADCTALTYCGDGTLQTPNGNPGIDEDCETPGVGSCDLQCQEIACVPDDGGWSAWGGWGSCSVSCGGGTQTHTRTCTNPAPNSCGADCIGSTQESQVCNTAPCCIDVNYVNTIPDLSPGFGSPVRHGVEIVIPAAPPGQSGYWYKRIITLFDSTCVGSWCSSFFEHRIYTPTGPGYDYSTSGSLKLYAIDYWNRSEPSRIPTNAVISISSGVVRFCPSPF